MLGGLTNLRYYLNDAGVMSMTGIKKLEFDDKKECTCLFSKNYLTFHKNRFLADFQKLIWFTYRTGFDPLLSRNSFLSIKNLNAVCTKDRKATTSDVGWGCMIRVLQMITSRVLCIIRSESTQRLHSDYFGEDTVHHKSDKEAEKALKKENDFKRDIIKLFLDNVKGEKAPFSIQNFVEHGYVAYKKLPGEWYGSNSASIVMERLNTYFKPDSNLEIVVFNDLGISASKCKRRASINCICHMKDLDEEPDFEIIEMDETNIEAKLVAKPIQRAIYKPCECEMFNRGSLYINSERYKETLNTSDCEEDKENNFDFDKKRAKIEDDKEFSCNWVKKLFIIVSVRLGLQTVPEEYYSSIKSILRMEQCVGIIGGKGNKALYFVGSEGDNLIFLDPHYVNEAVKAEDSLTFSLDTFSCDNPMKMCMSYLDPCLGFGFLINDESEFREFIKEIKKKKEKDCHFPIFIQNEEMEDCISP